MVSVSQVPAAAARLIFLYFNHLGGNILDALMCIALAHRANRGRVDGGVLVVDEEKMAMK